MKHRFSLFLVLSAALAAPALWGAPQTPAAENAPAEVAPPPAATAPEVPSAPVAPVDAPTPTPPAAEPPREALRDLTAETPAVEKPSAPPAVEADDRHRARRRGGREIVSFGGAHLPSGEYASVVVGILGDAHAQGEVSDSVVAILGDSTAEERVGGGMVAVLGTARARKDVGQQVVAVMGDAFVDGHVGGEVVAIMGTVHLGPKAVVDGEVVAIGGGVKRAPGSIINGAVNEVPFFKQVPFLASVGRWFELTILRGRFLAYDAGLIWTWFFALMILGFYVLVALVCGKAVNRCVDTLEQRPGRTILAALLTMIATPPLFILLTFTVIGPILFLLAMFVGIIFAKTAFLAFVGRRFTKSLGGNSAALAVLCGGLVVMLLYTVPIIGFIVWKISAALGLGMVVYTIILASQREKPARPAVAMVPATAPSNFVATPMPVPVPPSSSPAAVSPPPAAMPSGPTEPNLTVPPFTTVAVPSVPAAPPPVVSYTALPRAGFWIRLGASALDAILIGAVGGMLHAGDYFLLLYTAYCITMWATKGTTVGGVVCGLKLVRVDERKVDWSVALVRGLAAFLSLAVAGLGFIWVAFDDDKQSWHDKVAGTTIVHVPRGMSLV